MAEHKMTILGKLLYDSRKNGDFDDKELDEHHSSMTFESKEVDHDFCDYGWIHPTVKTNITLKGIHDYMFNAFSVRLISNYNKVSMQRNEKLMKELAKDEKSARIIWHERLSFKWNKIIQDYAKISFPVKQHIMLKSLFNVMYCMYELQLTFSMRADEYEHCTRHLPTYTYWNAIKLSINMQYRIYNKVLFLVVSEIVQLFKSKSDVNWNEYSISHLVDHWWRHISRSDKIFTFLKRYENMFDLDENRHETKFDFTEIDFNHTAFTVVYSYHYGAYLKQRQTSLKMHFNCVSETINEDLVKLKLIDVVPMIAPHLPRISHD